MANNDLVKKKPVALEVATYERLSKLAAQLRIDNPGGGFVSMSTAVGALLDKWEEAEMVASAIDACMQSLPNVSLRAYIADAEENDPQPKTGWAGTDPDKFLRGHGYRVELEEQRTAKYRVKIPCYHYNTGSADNYSYVAKHDFDDRKEAEELCKKAREQFTMFKRYEEKEISFDRYQKWLSKFDCYEVEDGYITGLAEVVEFYPEQEILQPENETE